MRIYEVWFNFYDGTMANSNGYRERVHVFLDKDKALAKVDELNSQREYENPYYLKEVDIDE